MGAFFKRFGSIFFHPFECFIVFVYFTGCKRKELPDRAKKHTKI